MIPIDRKLVLCNLPSHRTEQRRCYLNVKIMSIMIILKKITVLVFDNLDPDVSYIFIHRYNTKNQLN